MTDTPGPDLAYQNYLAEGAFMIQKCGGCGRHVFYPRVRCPHCASDALDWVRPSGDGPDPAPSPTRLVDAAELPGIPMRLRLAVVFVTVVTPMLLAPKCGPIFDSTGREFPGWVLRDLIEVPGPEVWITWGPTPGARQPAVLPVAALHAKRHHLVSGHYGRWPGRGPATPEHHTVHAGALDADDRELEDDFPSGHPDQQLQNGRQRQLGDQQPRSGDQYQPRA